MSRQEKIQMIFQIYVLQWIALIVAVLLIVINGPGPTVTKQFFEFPSFITNFLNNHPYFTLFCVIILAPIVEEIVFRGPVVLVRNRMPKWPLIWWICGGFLVLVFTLLFSTAFFALIHFRALIVTIFLFWTACLFTWEAIKSRSLWPSIINHIAWNTTIVVIFFTADSFSKLITG